MNIPDDAVRLDRAYPDLFTPTEADHLHAQMGPVQTFRGRERVIRASEVLHQSAYLSSGFLGRFCCDRQGRRQFVALQVPGDYVDLPAYLLKVLDHEMDSLGACSVRFTPHTALSAIVEDQPMLFRKLMRVSLIDSAIHRYWIFRVGRLAGKARLANFFCEMFVRLFARGLAQPSGYVLPTSQADLAEICGVTPVHVNRLLAELRLDGICTFNAGRLDIHDLRGLYRLGEHSRGYLFLPDSVEEALLPLLGRSPAPCKAPAPGPAATGG